MATFSIADCDPYEDPLAVIYLDDDPIASAHATIDRDVGRCINIAAQHLSNAWHMCGADLTMVDWIMPDRHKEPTPPGELDWMRAEVLHQRILIARKPGHEASEWTRELGGNYWWLWRNAMALLTVWQTIQRAPHTMTPVIYTLEVMPPKLLESAGQQTEPPVTMQQEYKVSTPDGEYYECVDSWRRYYLKRRANLLRWTARPAPAWARL